jgi:small GTP-binding protein
MKKTDRQYKKFLSPSTLLKLPATIGTIRSFLDSVNWKSAEDDVRAELKQRIAIVGKANTGKSTLFNKIQGRYRSEVSAIPGTTLGPVQGNIGPFVLVDTPGHLHDVQIDTARDASVIIFLIDGTRRIENEDRQLYSRLQALKHPIVTAVNKIDALRGDPDAIAAQIAVQLNIQDVIPISGKVGTNIADELLPALIEASPEAALAIGRHLPSFRRLASEKLIRNATLISLAAGLEPIPLVDIPIILSNQIRMILRLAAIYGEPLSSLYVRELITAIAGSLAMRYLAEEAAKAVPFGGDFVSGAIAAGGTWAIGNVALEYFENGKKLDTEHLRQRFIELYRRFRADPSPQHAAKQPVISQRIPIDFD